MSPPEYRLLPSSASMQRWNWPFDPASSLAFILDTIAENNEENTGRREYKGKRVMQLILHRAPSSIACRTRTILTFLRIICSLLQNVCRRKLRSQAIHYINAQLTALYENSVDCLKNHSTSDKSREQYEYAHALAEYSSYNARGHKLFHANFDKPQLEFICNHDAILRLKIHKGYYRLDYTKASNMAYSEEDKVQTLSEVEVVFRVSFDTRGLRGKDTKIGNGQNLIQLIVLDLPKAYLISSSPAVIIGRDAFVHYLSQYLTFLHQAGNPVLFSLPDFDDDEHRLTIDYSLMGSPVYDVDEIHGVTVEKINTYLSSVWLKAAMLAGGENEEVVDWKSTCLAEFRSPWSMHADSDVHFHIKLGAPRIKPICTREVVLYFTIDEVLFYEGTDFDCEPHRRYASWEVAVLVDVVHEFDGHVTRFKLDLATARPYQPWCTFTDVDETDEIAVRYCTRMLQFFTTHYLDVLESVDFHVIYHFDSRWQLTHTHRIDDESDSEDEDVEWTIFKETKSTKVTEWKEMVTRCDMHGFDQIISISQSSLNVHFNTLWELGRSSRNIEYTGCLAKWNYDNFFSATFKPVTLRLLSNERAIVWINMEHGNLKTLKNWLPWSASETHHFNGWRLAFEVDLKKCAHADLHVHELWHLKHRTSHTFKEHGEQEDRYLEHLYLDLHHAEFLHEFSTFDGLFQQHDHRPIDKVQAVVHYIRSHYFPHMADMGLNIIHTLPVWKTGTSLPSFALTSVAFHVYSKVKVTRHNWAHVSATSEPVIVLLGMTNFRPLPHTHLDYSANFVIRVTKGVSYGTVCISRSAFMEKRLLHLLNHVNALTTIIPLFSGVDHGVWKLKLTTWADHEWRHNSNCDWEVASEREGVMKYKWQHRDGWKYEHEGSGEHVNGTYAVSCLTRNFVELPTAARNRSMDIKIWGEVELEMSFKSDHKQGSAKSVARWNATLCVHTGADGLRVKVAGSPSPTIEKTQYVGDSADAMFTDLQAHLQKHLPRTVDLSAVLNELKAFEGVWQFGYPGMQAYCLANPVFNHKGDVIFELRPHGQQHALPSGHRHVSASVGRKTSYGSLSRSSPRPSISSRPSFLQKVKGVITSAVNGEGHSNGYSVGNGSSTLNGHAHAQNGHTSNGHVHTDISVKEVSLSDVEAYPPTPSMSYDLKVGESEIDVEEEHSFLVSETSTA